MEVTEEQINEINNTVRKSNLKVQGLLDRLGTQTQNYENLVADLRVEITELTDEVNKLKELLKAHQENANAKVEYVPEDEDPEVVQGEVVS